MSTIPAFNPDRGPDAILYPGQQPAPHGLPSGHSGPSQHDQVSHKALPVFPDPASLDTYLSQQLCPARFSSTVLASASFEAALGQAQRDLHDAVLENPESHTVLSRAIRVLGDELDLRGLMTMYRNALLQG